MEGCRRLAFLGDVASCALIDMLIHIAQEGKPMSVHDFTVKAADGTDKSLADFAGKPILIVNTASKCGFTYQYEGLEALNRKYAGKLSVIAFPCNQFGAQEPGDAAEIANFCKTSYDVTFPVMRKLT